MLDWVAGVFNGIFDFFASLINGFLSLLTFNPIQGFLDNVLTPAWAACRPAWNAIKTFLPVGIIVDAARALVPFMVMVIVIMALWRLSKFVGNGEG